MRPEDNINFSSYDWKLIKMWAQKQKEVKIGLLVATDDHDKSAKLRGAISVIDQLLSLETAPKMGPTQN